LSTPQSPLHSGFTVQRDRKQELPTARDELEIKVAERTSELRRSERELRDVVDTIPAIVWSALAYGSNAYVNSRFVEYAGMSAEQLAGSGWHTATHPDDFQRHERKWLAWPAVLHSGAGEAHYLDWNGGRTKGAENGGTNMLGRRSTHSQP
jgi:PAS domain-containing protein